jgi:hypothetical protein
MRAIDFGSILQDANLTLPFFSVSSRKAVGASKLRLSGPHACFFLVLNFFLLSFRLHGRRTVWCDYDRAVSEKGNHSRPQMPETTNQSAFIRLKGREDLHRLPARRWSNRAKQKKSKKEKGTLN